MPERPHDYGPEALELSESPETERESTESRFGDKEAIRVALEKGDAHNMGPIENHYHVPMHRNKVDLAYVQHELIGARNLSHLTSVDLGGIHLEAVFKPKSGEDHTFNRQNGLRGLSSREEASYLISEHFGFDLVPPTVVRPVEGQVGSLQLFMPFDTYRNGLDVTLSDTEADLISQSPDLAHLAMFDWITAQGDRQGGNYMYKVEQNTTKADTSEGQVRLVAIDNGISLNDQFYRMKASPGRMDLPGPYHYLTTEGPIRPGHPSKPVYHEIPAPYLEKIAKGFQDHQRLDQNLLALEEIDQLDVTRMWQRVEALLTYRTFLSAYNAQLSPDKSRYIKK